MSARMLDVEGFILVGGASSRMGTDKSQLLLSGKTAVARIADMLRTVAKDVRVVGALSGELASIPDIHPHWGPLGGIHAALNAAATDWCLIVACDLPFVTRDLFGRLFEFAEAGVDAVVPLQDDSRPQPLSAFYRRRACLLAAEESIARDEHSPRALLDKVQTKYVAFDQLADLDGAEHFFSNVNTPENYDQARKIASLFGPDRQTDN